MTLGKRLPAIVDVPLEKREETEALPEVKRETMDKLSLRFKVTELPKLTSPPPDRLVPAVIVTLELVRALLGMSVKVLDPPDMVLLVMVWVLSCKTNLPEVKVMSLKVGEEVLVKL